jgi:hypothetical protein
MKNSLITNRTLASSEEDAKTRFQEVILGRHPEMPQKKAVDQPISQWNSSKRLTISNDYQ